MKKIIFGRKSYVLNFVIDNERIYLQKKIKQSDNLTEDQKWVLTSRSFLFN